MKVAAGLATFVVVVVSSCFSEAFLIPSPRCPSTTTTTTTTSASNIISSSSNTMTTSSSTTTKLMSTAAPSTSFVGSTLTDMDLAYEAIGKFFNKEECEGVTFKQTSGGVNNIGMYTTLKDGRHYVMRIYNNGNNRERVEWEHEILKQLNQQQLSFSIPKALPSMENPKKNYAPLSNGADACVFETIPGTLPKLTCVADIGRASGELLGAIQKVDVSHLKCPTPPYADLYAVHHAVTRDAFYKTMAGPDFDGIREAATKAVKAIEEMEEKLKTFEAEKLPTCLIHADLHYDNILVSNGKATGLLDFEFAAIDYRAMELAVCLSKYAGEKGAMDYFNDFIEGYTKNAILTEQEMRVIPTLINLRILSNVVYFVGRALGGEDDISSITTRLENYLDRVAFVDANAEAMINKIREEANKNKKA